MSEKSNHPSSRTVSPTPPSGNVGQPGPSIHPVNGEWRPKSNRVGIGPCKYVWWNWYYAVMEFLNRKLASDPNRKVSWDKWPPMLGLLYLIAKVRYNRSNALTDPYDYKSKDNDPPGSSEPACAHATIAADAKWVSDQQNGQMGSAMTRFGSNFAPRKVRPDVEKITPLARQVSKQLRWRKLDPAGNEITVPALILNVAAQAWIQFQFHGFGGNTLRDPINKNPIQLSRDPSDNWPENSATVDRTTKDPTRVTEDGRPTPINERAQAWVQSQLYGSNQAELDRIRSFKNGNLALDDDGNLLEDPSRPGVDLTGFSNNYNPFLSFLHWLFTLEHNSIAKYMQGFHPDWTDEQLFQMSRKINCAQIARIHTVEWTEDLLQHPTLQLGMHADWYGLFGQKAKCYLMRLSHRHPGLKHVLKPITDNDVLWGMPGSAWDHHDGPFQVPKHFRLVYRLHEMILGKNEIVDPQTGKLLESIDLLEFVHEKTRKQVKKFGYEVLAWSFVSKSCGALSLHNFPRSLAQFNRMQDNHLIDLAELDILREREDGTGTYNDLRRSLGEPPVTSFIELTGGNPELAKELEIVYEGDVDKVDAGIGILAEPKPEGFALGFVQFYQFVLNAPRRVKSNRFLSEGYNYDEYQEGMNWVEHGGGFKGAIRRHLPALRSKLEGVKRGFAPWPEPETFPERILSDAEYDIGKAFRSMLRTIFLLSVTGLLVANSGLVDSHALIAIISILLFAAVIVALNRMFARRFFQVCEKSCNTDKRSFMFGTLYSAERKIQTASLIDRCACNLAISISLIWTVVSLYQRNWLGLLFILVATSAIFSKNWATRFEKDMEVLKVALRNRMRAGAGTEPNTTESSSTPEREEIDRLFTSYAPGREYLTQYDFTRMHEGERLRETKSGRGNMFTGFIEQLNNNDKAKRLLTDHADLLVEEDREIVTAISKDTYLRSINGSAGQQLSQEKSDRAVHSNLEARQR